MICTKCLQKYSFSLTLKCSPLVCIFAGTRKLIRRHLYVHYRLFFFSAQGLEGVSFGVPKAFQLRLLDLRPWPRPRQGGEKEEMHPFLEQIW